MLQTDLSITAEELVVSSTSKGSIQPAGASNKQCQLCVNFSNWFGKFFHSWQGLVLTSLIGAGGAWFYFKKYKK